MLHVGEVRTPCRSPALTPNENTKQLPPLRIRIDGLTLWNF